MLKDVEVNRSFMKRMKSTREMTRPWGKPIYIYILLKMTLESKLVED